MLKRYFDCGEPDGNCAECALVHCGMDCHNVPISPLAWARMAHGMSQADLAAKAGISFSTLQKYESGGRSLRKASVETILALVTALELDGSHEFEQTLAALGVFD